jgi:hypothetical protein
MSYHLVFIGFTALSVMAWLSIMKKKAIPTVQRVCIAVALMITAPYLYLYGRGNYLVIVVMCISWFFAWYNSEKRWQREISLVLLAVAAGIKLYPALLAAILLKERRFLDFFKTVVYTILAFFIPFLVLSSLTSGHIFIASGLVPKTSMIFFIDYILRIECITFIIQKS